MANSLRIIDEIEQLVEKGKGRMGQRFVNEEEFFTQIQRLRSALPQEMKGTETSRGASKSVAKIIEEPRFLTDKEQLQIVAILSARLLEKQL